VGVAPFEQSVIRRLKLRELRILTTVAQAGSMGRAAAQLALSQPAVSKAIAEMEHTLGVDDLVGTHEEHDYLAGLFPALTADCMSFFTTS
jgi:hypothetical protein